MNRVGELLCRAASVRSAAHSDEFFGILYHLNTEEEPEDEDYPTDPKFKERHGQRGVLHTRATDTVDETVDPRFGKVGKQRIVDTGPLTRKRMETADGELVNEGIKFMDKARADGKPFFVWFATTRMHTFMRVESDKGVRNHSQAS